MHLRKRTVLFPPPHVMKADDVCRNVLEEAGRWRDGRDPVTLVYPTPCAEHVVVFKHHLHLVRSAGVLCGARNNTEVDANIGRKGTRGTCMFICISVTIIRAGQCMQGFNIAPKLTIVITCARK